jgi:hypothetical protein
MIARKNEIAVRETNKKTLNNCYIKWQIADDLISVSPLKKASGYV